MKASERHYYRYKGYYPYLDRKTFSKADGIIIKCYTDTEVEKFYGNSCQVWERVD